VVAQEKVAALEAPADATRVRAELLDHLLVEVGAGC
jgi:hypothetical protein